MDELNELMKNWQETETGTKKAYQVIIDHLQKMENTTLDFKGRPGVSYSLRPRHDNQKSRALFAMADVIDDDPKERWLSVCFYGDMVTDPEERGDLIPEGLLGDDGYCFDLDEYDEEGLNYILARLTEAHAKAAQEN